MSVLVLDSDSAARNKTLRMLKGMGCEAESASHSSVLRAALNANPLSLLLIATHDEPQAGLAACSELRRRHVGGAHPQVVLHGPVHTPRQLLSAFELGVNDWVGNVDYPLLEWYTSIGRQMNEPRTSSRDTLHALRGLASGVEGVFRCNAGKIDARIEVRGGRICHVALTPNSRPLMRVVELEARRNLAQVDAWLRRMPQQAGIRKALIDSGLWERVRLRDAIANHARYALSVLNQAQRVEICFEPRRVQWAADLCFTPDEVLPDVATDSAPHSFLRTKLDFLQRIPDNDVRMSSAS